MKTNKQFNLMQSMLYKASNVTKKEELLKMEKFICLQKHTKSLQLKDSKLVPNHDLIPNMQYVQYN